MKKRIFKTAVAVFFLVFFVPLTLMAAYGPPWDPKTESPPEPEGVRVAVATDLHYLSPELTDNGELFTEIVSGADGKVMLYIDALVRAFAAQIAEEAPDALILSGDLTFNGERLSHEHLAAILSAVEASGVPVFVMPGNHDLYSGSAASFSGEGYELTNSVTAEEFAEIYGAFGYDEALSRDEDSLSYTARLSPGLILLMVDVNTYSYAGAVKQETLDWAEQQLAAAQESGEQVLAVTHQNLYAHNPYLSAGYIIENSIELYELYCEYGVRLNLSGHIHLQHILDSGDVCEIATSSLAVSPNQYGVLSFWDEGGGKYETRSVDVSSWAEGQGQTDENLLNFAEYSRQFFRNTSLNQALSEAAGQENASELAGFYADVNENYFAGRTDLIEWDDALAEDWKKCSFFIGIYLASIHSSEPGDFTQLNW